MISIIIPVLNEERALEELLPLLRRQAPDAELIVADGGSDDQSREIASRANAHWVESATGRGAQMNAGAAAAAGSILLFLHADTLLQDGWPPAVRETAGDERVALGAFRFRLDDDAFSCRILETGVRLRSALFRLPYGDQAFFLRREAFQQAGGYPEWPIMEDVELVRRAKQQGRIKVLSLRATTSARRWHSNGFFRQTMLNLSTIIQYRLGRPVDDLAWRYRRSARAVAVFCKLPSPGSVKTRLAASIGDGDAVKIYKRMVQHTLEQVHKCNAHGRTLIFYAPETAEPAMREWLGKRHRFFPQHGGDLGDRMLDAFRRAASNGVRELLIIGTDCPGLTTSHLDQAFRALSDHDIVLGPTRDGGYFLIGADRPLPCLFKEIAWSTGAVFEQTMAIAARESLHVAQLEKLTDVDTVDDLDHYPALRKSII
jgi:rSAM/selenodomain-associated transferase 2/rSAM/selenodomain-associated transferase 1